MNKQDYEILCTMVASKDRPPEYAVKLLEDTCEALDLDWKLRHLYLMQKGTKWMVTLSIDGFRLIGSQDPDYGGQEGPFWVTNASPEAQWSDIPPDGPIYAAKVGIKHRSGVVTYGVVRFKDYKAGPMWDKFPSNMSAKCAEMLAWRKAFPGRLGGLYGAEEMEQAQKRGGKKEEPEVKSGASDVAPDAIARYRQLIGEATADTIAELGKTLREDRNLEIDQALALSVLYKAKRAELGG